MQTFSRRKLDLLFLLTFVAVAVAGFLPILFPRLTYSTDLLGGAAYTIVILRYLLMLVVEDEHGEPIGDRGATARAEPANRPS
jgi:cytochrome b subunit of formate dehydrogenase